MDEICLPSKSLSLVGAVVSVIGSSLAGASPSCKSVVGSVVVAVVTSVAAALADGAFFLFLSFARLGLC